MKSNITLKLFDNDLSTPIFVGDLTDRCEGLQFSTILPGGFGICSFNFSCDIFTAWRWRTDYIFYRVVIKDNVKVLFEGRLEDIEFIDSGLKVTFFGYFSSCGDQPNFDDYNTTSDAAIKTILTASCPDISSDHSNIEATDITIAQIAGNEDLYLVDLVSKLAAYSNTSQLAWYFAIWEDRIPYFFPRSMASVDWVVSLRNVETLGLRVTVGELWNSVYAVYTTAGVRSRTAIVTDTNSISKYGVTRTKAIINLGEVSAAAAQAQRNWVLEENKDLQQHTDRFVIGESVKDNYGVETSSAHIRAGEVIRIQDLVPASADLDTVTRDALRTFYIKETQYDVDAKRMTIIPDTARISLTSRLVRDFVRKGLR